MDNARRRSWAAPLLNRPTVARNQATPADAGGTGGTTKTGSVRTARAASRPLICCMRRRYGRDRSALAEMKAT